MATIKGTIADDLLRGTGLDDFIFGDAGNDTIAGTGGDDVIYGGAGNDTLSGGSGNDTLDGGEGADIINGNSGDDTIVGGDGDVVNGGSGFDTLDYSAISSGVTVDLSKHTISWAGGSSTAQSIEKFIGTAFDDVIRGGSADNVLIGGDGNDVLRGGAGADTLSGGNGKDTFVFNVKDVVANGVSLGVDTITDFNTNDEIDLRSFFKDAAIDPQDYNNVIQLEYDGTNTTLSVQNNGAFVDVATIAGNFSVQASLFIEDKIILV